MDKWRFLQSYPQPTGSAGLLLCVFFLLLLGRATIGHAQEDEIITGGSLKYQQYCASCHGKSGRGDGTMAPLLTFPPANLTQLSKNNKGEFPFWDVYRMIDGRQEVRGHGTREMPLWGFVFKAEEGPYADHLQEDLMRGRIWQLVYFLESIQEK